MSEMSSKLEQVLEYLVNGEQDQAESLLHDVIVEKARRIHEELVNSQDTVEEAEDTAEAVEEADSTNEEAVEESEESEEETVEEQVGAAGDAEAELKNELKQKAEEDAEEIEYEETNEEDEAEGEDEAEEEVEDRVDDLEKALEELKAKFDDIMNGDDKDSEDEMSDDEESMMPAEESVQDLEEAELKPVKVDHKDGSDATKSPVASKNDMGGTASNIAQGGDEKGASAPKATDMGSTTEPNMSEVKADSKDGADASAKSTISGK